MKIEYLFTTDEKAELADIDRQIAMLCARKSDIYLHAKVKHIPETIEERDGISRLREYLYTGMNMYPEGVITIKPYEKGE